MKVLNMTALTLVIIGALNWLLIGLFKFNLVDTIFGELSILSRLIYILVGISGLWSIAFFSKIKDQTFSEFLKKTLQLDKKTIRQNYNNPKKR